MALKQKMSLRFTTDGMVVQRFSLPTPITDYIFNNAKPEHLVKFYKSCKYFYAQYRRNFIKNLVICECECDNMLDEDTTTLWSMSRLLDKIKDFEIYQSLAIFSRPPSYYNFGKFITCLECACFISLEDYKTLTSSERLEELKIQGVFNTGIPVTDEGPLDDDQMAPVETLIECIPFAKSITFMHTRVTTETGAKMMRLEHKSKISIVVLSYISPDELFDVQSFIKFLKKNADDGCAARIEFMRYEPDAVEDNNALDELEIANNLQIQNALNGNNI